MYCLAKFCEICMKNGDSLLSTNSSDMVKFREKLNFLVPEVNKNYPELICRACHKNFLELYNFKSMLMRNKRLLNNYQWKLSKESNSKKVRAQLCVSLVGSSQHEKAGDSFTGEKEFMKLRSGKRSQRAKNSTDEKLDSKPDAIVLSDNLLSSVRTKMAVLSRKNVDSGAVPASQGQKKKPRNCSVCGKKYVHIDKHLLVHSKEVHVCSVCSKVFDHKAGLGTHLLTHIASKDRQPSESDVRFHCLQCNKFFLKKYYFERHEMMHQL